jgi:hypothetical protein
VPSPEPVPPPRECSKKKLCRRRKRNASHSQRIAKEANGRFEAIIGTRGSKRYSKGYSPLLPGTMARAKVLTRTCGDGAQLHGRLPGRLHASTQSTRAHTRAHTRAPTRAHTGRGCLQRVARLCGRARLLEDLLAILRSCSSLGSPRATLHRYAAPCRRRVPHPSAAQAAAGRATLHGCATRGVLQVHGTLGTCRMLHARPQDRGTKSGGEC